MGKNYSRKRYYGGQVRYNESVTFQETGVGDPNYAPTPLILAIRSTNYDTNYKEVQRLLAEGADVNEPDNYGTTPLMAAVGASFPIFELILGSGADVNAQNNEGWTALMWGAFWRMPGVVRALLETPSILGNEMNNQGQSAIDLADEATKEVIRNHLNSTRGGKNRKTKKPKKTKKPRKTKKTRRR
jgi:ankyrin repeat protein